MTATPSWRIDIGDARERLARLEDGSVHCVVTSPPYFGLRDYGHANQIGLEATPEAFVASLVAVFRQVHRVLRDDGTLWLNLGDSYATRWSSRQYDGRAGFNDPASRARRGETPPGLKSKDLIGIPWTVAFALRADGWHLRSDIVWAKPNPMPESVTDRPTRSHEFVFLLSKRPRYFYDAEAIREDTGGGSSSDSVAGTQHLRGMGDGRERQPSIGRNKRDVWSITPMPYAGAHFATFPPDLVEPCVLAGAPERACAACGAPWERIVKRERTFDGQPVADAGGWAGPDGPRRMNDGAGHYRWATTRQTLGFRPSCSCHAGTVPGVVLDPFSGAGTTGLVALRHRRSYVGIEVNLEYAELSRRRIIDDAPLFNHVAEEAA